MNRSQSTIFFIFGLLAVVFAALIFTYFSQQGFSIYRDTSKEHLSFSDMRKEIGPYIEGCIADSAKESLSDTGIREESLDEYEQLVISKARACVLPYLSELSSFGYIINEGSTYAEAEINDETIILFISYPLTIKKEGQKVEFGEFRYSFDRSVSIRIPGGVTEKEIRIDSQNGKAQLIVPKGTIITDSNGNKVESIGIKVKDVHFDGLENRYAVGQLVYDNFPDGATFSEPIQMTIEFRTEDIPAGYDAENLMITYWDEGLGIWYAVETEIIGDKAYANITHFTDFTLSALGLHFFESKLFETRFKPTGASAEGTGEKAWAIGGVQQDKGTATLQFTYPSLNDYKGSENYQDFREKFKDTNFILRPKLEYGYYVDPENPNSDFINCEPEEPAIRDNVEYLLYEDGYPYINILGARNLFCSEDQPCPVDGSAVCQGKSYGQILPGLISVCLPYDNDTKEFLKKPFDQNNKPDMPCCSFPYDKDDFTEEVFSQDYEFGWHNYQCAGGRVLPEEGFPFSDFIIFEGKGNAVLFEKTLRATEKPPKNWPWYKEENTAGDIADFMAAFKILNNLYLEGTGNIILDYALNKAGELGSLIEQSEEGMSKLPFYCRLNNFDSGSILGRMATNDALNSRLGLGPGKTQTIYGIKSLDIIKMTDHPDAKTELNTECSVYWSFVGEGVIPNNPEPKYVLDQGINKIIGLVKQKIGG